MSTQWATQLDALVSQGIACVVVTILSTKGSTPRQSGSKMLVTTTDSFYSIGGGHLEHQAIKLSINHIENKEKESFIKEFSLGASLGQCCGGHIQLLFEAYYPPQQHVVIFGAGHIAKALVPILAQLPCSVSWIDDRAELFPAKTPDNTQVIIEDTLVACDQIPDNSYVLIMTHNHHIDLRLCELLLTKNKHAFIGLIGSKTKWKKFTLRLARKDFSELQISSICCPIGIDNVTGKLPIEIAVSVSAQFIQHYQQSAAANLTLVDKTSTQA